MGVAQVSGSGHRQQRAIVGGDGTGGGGLSSLLLSSPCLSPLCLSRFSLIPLAFSEHHSSQARMPPHKCRDNPSSSQVPDQRGPCRTETHLQASPSTQTIQKTKCRCMQILTLPIESLSSSFWSSSSPWPSSSSSPRMHCLGVQITHPNDSHPPEPLQHQPCHASSPRNSNCQTLSSRRTCNNAARRHKIKNTIIHLTLIALETATPGHGRDSTESTQSSGPRSSDHSWHMA